MIGPSICKFSLLVIIAERNNQIQEIKEIHLLTHGTLRKIETNRILLIYFWNVLPRKVASQHTITP